MIRTDSVKMTTLEGIAYKQKLASGGAGITIITTDERAVATINKRDGKCIPYGKVDIDTFTEEVFNEAVELTQGLAYKRLPNITKMFIDCNVEEDYAGDDKIEAVEFDVLTSDEYTALIKEYTDKNGKFSYQLMNKDLIQFAAKSKTIQNMLQEEYIPEAIVRHIVRVKASNLTKNENLSVEMITALMDTLNSMDPRSAFKELTQYLRTKMGR